MTIASRSQVQTSPWTTGRLARTVGAVLEGHSEVSVTGVQEDSRSCMPGDLFVAIQGTDQDGLRYAADAVSRGAVAIAAERDPRPYLAGLRAGFPAVSPAVSPAVFPSGDLVAGVPWLRIANARTGAGRLADLVYDNPSRKMALIGVTGTNGKTTTAHLLRQILPGPVGFIGTTGVDWPGKRGGATKAVNTTPGPTAIRRHLCDMLDAGCIACVMEVSSHAMSQGRTDGLHFSAAIYTNLTGDHLDYHGTPEAYAAAKARLFTGLTADAFAVLNAVDPACSRLETRAQVRWFRPDDVRVSNAGTRFLWRDREVFTPFVGRHNAENAAAALETSVCLGADPEEAIRMLAGAVSARGRLEVIAREPTLVLVDYAHTDDALLQAIHAVREVTEGRVIVVFGCGGDRDRTKRPRMGAIAAQWSDQVYITNDNPRTEDPARIAAEILAGTGNAGATVILDRRAAIRAALRSARPGDAVLIAGKGHEDEQIVGTERRSFDDAQVARSELGKISESP